MHRLISKYLAFLLLISLFLPACQREQEGAQETEVPMEGEWKAIPYRATVSSSAKTKATLDAIDVHYVFERDDLLYVVDKTTEGNVLYGYLYLTSGAGSRTAVFEGDLMYFVKKSTDPAPEVYEPERPANNLVVTATLVSKAQRDADVYTFVSNNEGKIATGPNFGDKYASTFKEAVQKYSTFTADATYGNPSFSLVQGTAFLLFSLSFDDGIAGSLTVSVTNNNGAQTLFSHSVTPDVNYEASFVAAFPGGTISLSNAKLGVSDGGSYNITRPLASLSLQGNHYYNVVKTFLDLSYFTIQAVENTTISFPAKYQAAAYGLQYSSDGSNWTNVSDTPSFPLAAGNSVKVRGKGSKYQNSDGSAPLFSSTAACYIYGDIMSLFCDGSYNKKTAFGGSNSNALEGTFKNMTNLDIHPARPLLLSATTLSSSCYLSMFEGCTGLTRAPEFNNEEGAFPINIPSSACKQMFKGCTSLSAAPELPATGTIASQGYYGMFNGCTALLTPPSRLAVTPSGGNGHFREMFNGCTSLLLAPELTATVILQDGCRSMFNGCTSLQEAPELLANTISGTYACAYMFQNCTSLTQGPSALLATDMQNYCYASMFKGCTLLDAAPRIDATTLAEYCFQEMFSGCIALRTAQDAFSFTGSIPQYACKRMFYNCQALTGAPEMSSVNGTIYQSGCQEMYSGCEAMTTGPSSLNATTVNQQGYYQMFLNCRHLLASPAIAATDVGQQGCQEMFKGCSRMQTPPASLSATTLSNAAYKWMFYQCSALTSIPDFPHDPAVTYVLPVASETKTGLCYQMFFQCNALTSLAGKKLFSSTTLMTPFCFEDMFSECRNLASVPTDFLPATSVAASCYRGMFQSTKITRTPDLPASTLASECYRYMFNGCSQLTYIKCLATTNIGNGYTTNWVGNNKTGGNVPNTSDCTFVRADAATSWPEGVHGILSNWTIKPVSEE